MTRQNLGSLWARYRRVRERAAGIACPTERRLVDREATMLRDRLVVNYSPLARYVAGRIFARSPGPVDREDLVSWGLFGLLGAVETYDPSRPAKFETYAISKIRWSILDELRKTDPLPRTTRLRVQRVERARCELAQCYGRSPTESEVAVRLGVSIADHRAFLEKVARSRVGSLEARSGCDPAEGGLHELVADQFGADPAQSVESSELRSLLVRAIEGLGEQERVVTTFYYYEGLTLREIGGALGLTEGRISQILRASRLRLREALLEMASFPESLSVDS
ncbi:FliA/WhiG family RNA polymerase sigma factor [Rubrobacter tropicus]|uniref:FliA/WhiG family RNA polymerase sigma factor n=1 Tax=Rubrobacter tropicus TaxID=2653851 RepID=A0A6G8Q937_9ACTN|nr:FliA/WhiG family RNA polymerase sigma factor [Rubrobacter tropicus]QIN82959.1 FliA/WhiG family RNA polymerase sigma factor [Rubrobacter tropicus]